MVDEAERDDRERSPEGVVEADPVNADVSLSHRIGVGVASIGAAMSLAGCNAEVSLDDEEESSEADDSEESDADDSEESDADGHTHSYGRGSNAIHEGVFLIADSSPQSFSSKRPDEVRTQMPIYAPAFNTTSARAAKTGLDPVDPRTILEGVEDLPIHTWRFADNSVHGDGVRHLGPMVEDFHDAFDLDEPDDAIATVDADGVVFAAIQGTLNRLKTRNKNLRAELKTLDVQIDEVESRLDRVASERDEP